MNSILLTTDGTYPCYRGGVSVWCDQLIRQLSDVRFHVFAITYSPSHTPVFDRPANITSQHVLPLWGVDQPGIADEGLAAALRRKARTTGSAIRKGFLEPFELCIRSVLQPESSPQAMADALLAMSEYFRDHDYSCTLSSAAVWDAFLRVACGVCPNSDRYSLHEATTCMRWVQHYLTVLTVQLPDTDLVHASMAGLAGIPGVLQKRRGVSRFLLSEHGIFLRELYVSLSDTNESTRCRRFLFAWHETIARMNYYYADAVSSLCEFNQRWQVRLGAAPEKIYIVPNGVDPAVFSPGEPTERSPSKPTVLTMARIYPLKGIEYLLRAARLVLDRVPGVRWRILGEIGDRRYYEQCLKLAGSLGISHRIEWGQTAQPAAAYRAADVFCLPSISEAMPYSVLEAMFSGCPVVATDVGGVAETLGGAGLVVPPRDASGMARAILSLLEGHGAAQYRQEMSFKALNRARRLYTLEQSSSRFREIYELSGKLQPSSVFAAR